MTRIGVPILMNPTLGAVVERLRFPFGECEPVLAVGAIPALAARWRRMAMAFLSQGILLLLVLMGLSFWVAGLPAT